MFFKLILSLVTIIDTLKNCDSKVIVTDSSISCPIECSNSCDSLGKCTNCSNPGLRLPLCRESCTSGRFGMNCQHECRESCKNRLCDATTGDCFQCKKAGVHPPNCSTPCSAGTFGFDCKDHCPGICSHACDPVSGDCIDCERGKGPHCSVDCNKPSESQTCQKYCPSKCIASCNTTNGRCSACHSGFRPPFCNVTCDDGFYGTNCLSKCSDLCKEKKCDPKTGFCSIGCVPGYVGDLCNGMCLEGFHGDRCSRRCPETCANGLCNFRTGHCTKCRPGFKGDLCQDFCPGGNCQPRCPVNCDGQCDLENGQCWRCGPGWRGPFCNETCLNGQFGQNCSNQCSVDCIDRNCHHINGTCLRCKTDFKGSFCNESVVTNNSSHILKLKNSVGFQLSGIVMIAVFAPATLLGVILCVYKHIFRKTGRRHQRKMSATIQTARTMNPLQDISSGSASSNGLEQDYIVSNFPIRPDEDRLKIPKEIDRTTAHSVDVVHEPMNAQEVSVTAKRDTSQKEEPGLTSQLLRILSLSKVSSRARIPGAERLVSRITTTATSSSESLTLREDNVPNALEDEASNTFTLKSSNTNIGPSSPQNMMPVSLLRGMKILPLEEKVNNDSIFNIKMDCNIQPAILSMATKTTTVTSTNKSQPSLQTPNLPHPRDMMRTTMSATARLGQTSFTRSVSQVKVSMTHSHNTRESVDSLYGIKSTELSMNTLSLPLTDKNDPVKEEREIHPNDRISLDFSAIFDDTSDSPGASKLNTNGIKLEQGSQTGIAYEKIPNDETSMPSDSESSRQNSKSISKKLEPVLEFHIENNIEDESAMSTDNPESDALTIPVPAMFSDEPSASEQSDTISTFPYYNLIQDSESGHSSCPEGRGSDVGVPPQDFRSSSESERSDIDKGIFPNTVGDLGENYAKKVIDQSKTNVNKHETSCQRSIQRPFPKLSGFYNFREMSTVLETHDTEYEDGYIECQGNKPDRLFMETSPPQFQKNECSNTENDKHCIVVSTSTGDLYKLFHGEAQTEIEAKMNNTIDVSTEISDPSQTLLAAQSTRVDLIKDVSSQQSTRRAPNHAPKSDLKSVIRCPVTRQKSPAPARSLTSPQRQRPQALPGPPTGARHTLHHVKSESLTIIHSSDPTDEPNKSEWKSFV